MKRRSKLAAIMLAAALLIVLPVFALAENEKENAEKEISEELSRQLSGMDLKGWDRYFEGLGSWKDGFSSMEEILKAYAEGKASDEPVNLFEAVRRLMKSELSKALAPAAALSASALITALSGMIGSDELKRTLSFILSTASITLTAGMLASLCGIASAAVKSIGDLVAATMPIISALLVSIGAPASAGVFRPLMTFLSGTVVITICGAVLPLTLACGITAVADSLTEGSRFAELVKLLKKSVKWLLGLISTVYFGMTAVRGMTVAAYDGVSVRTAKYAVDKLVPVVGGMVSGTVDTVMGCALLIKNGVGAIAILILVSVLARPLVILAAGIFVFRLAAAVSQPAADERTVRLFSNAAETVSLLFACVVSAGCMMAVTMLVFIASGGISAGLW